MYFLFSRLSQSTSPPTDKDPDSIPVKQQVPSMSSGLKGQEPMDELV